MSAPANVYWNGAAWVPVQPLYAQGALRRQWLREAVAIAAGELFPQSMQRLVSRSLHVPGSYIAPQQFPPPPTGWDSHPSHAYAPSAATFTPSQPQFQRGVPPAAEPVASGARKFKPDMADILLATEVKQALHSYAQQHQLSLKYEFARSGSDNAPTFVCRVRYLSPVALS